MQNKSVTSIDTEFAAADFGDKRLNDRVKKLAHSLSQHPAVSFPEANRCEAALEATYRFFGNTKVTPEKILSPHIEATIERALSQPDHRVVVAHDTTAFIFSGDQRSELGWVNQGGRGFLAHFSLAISRCDQARHPLGVLGIIPFFRTGPAKGKHSGRSKKNRSSTNESLRWWHAIENSQGLFPAGFDPIHLADREADDYDLLSRLHEQRVRFIIRIRQNRAACQIPGEPVKDKLFSLCSGLEVIARREVAISKRGFGQFPSSRKDRQPRSARSAMLHITASAVVIPRPQFQYSDLPETITINCVHAYEVEAPRGLEPVDWMLLTSEPISTEEDLLNIIDDYRARWLIEEYFKALKTGCSFEKRQLETKKSLLNALFVFAPIAWQLLLLRMESRSQPTRSARVALTKTQIEVLKAVSPKLLPDDVTIGDATMAIAALGGHIANNGPPGWQTLAKGMQTLLTMEVAWTAAHQRYVES